MQILVGVGVDRFKGTAQSFLGHFKTGCASGRNSETPMGGWVPPPTQGCMGKVILDRRNFVRTNVMYGLFPPGEFSPGRDNYLSCRLPPSGSLFPNTPLPPRQPHSWRWKRQWTLSKSLVGGNRHIWCQRDV